MWTIHCHCDYKSKISLSKLEGSRREDNDAIILSRRSKFKSIEGVLVKSKVYLAGNFNVNLSNLTQKIELSGGKVINEIAGADIVVVGDQPRDEDIQSMSKTITPWTDLEAPILQSNGNGRIPLGHHRKAK
jgi:hypothetical protein